MQKDFDLVYENISPDYKKSGCYVTTPELLKQRHNQHILVPLKISDYHLEIVNSITNVTLSQTYHNPTDKFLEMEYNFPIHPSACIYKFSAQFGNTRIEGIVKEKQQARKQYKQAVQQGRKATLGQIKPQSKDIMTLKVGNVPPFQTVRIEIGYLQQLSLSCNTFYQLHMSGTITPRYVRQLSEIKIQNAFRNQASKAKGQFYWNFKITLKTSRKVAFFDSHTHPLELLYQNDAKTISELIMAKPSAPHKDFTFSFTTEQFHLPSCVYGQTDSGSTALLSFIPKFCELTINDAYKAAVAGRQFETEMGKVRGQYIFLLDRSGSMTGARIQKAKEALILFIKSLPQQAYFNVVSFGNSFQYLFSESAKYLSKQIEYAISKIKQMTADLGGTQIHKPLENILKKEPMKGYPRQIFLLTDGGVGDTTEVINLVARNTKYARVHTIGIGNGASQSLILGCAQKGKGLHTFISDNENPSAKIIQLLTDSLSPLVSTMHLEFDKQIVESVMPNPEALPCVLKNQIVNFYVTFKGKLSTQTYFKFSYSDSSDLPFETKIVVSPQVENIQFIDKMGHFKRIRLLQESLQVNGNVEDQMYFVKNVDKKAKIIEESLKHQILSEFTAFVCIQKELIDGQYQELIDKGKQKMMIEGPLPKQQEKQTKDQELALQQIQQMVKNLKLQSQCISRQLYTQADMISLLDSQMDYSTHKKSGCGGSYSGPAIRASATKKQQKSGGFFSNLFSSSKKETQTFKQDSHQQSIEQTDNKKIEQTYNKKTQQTSNKKEFINQEKELINQVIQAQLPEGSWNDINLIGLILGKSVQKKIETEQDLEMVVTFLICRWIQKHYPGIEYSLVVKKGLTYVKRQNKNLEELSNVYGKLVL